MNSVKENIFKLLNVRHKINLFYQSKIYPPLRIYYSICGIISLCLLILIYGFYYPHEWTHWIRLLVNGIVVSLVVYEALSFIFVIGNLFDYLKTHKTEAIVVFLILFQEIISQEIYELLTLNSLSGEDASLAFLSLSQLFLLFSNFSRLIRKTDLLNYRQISPSLVITGSFGILILLGTLALSLPRAQAVPIPTIDVFFTVVSAVCVTGLSTISVASQLTGTGQTILMILIQIGGLGLMTLTVFFAIFLAGQVSVTNKLLIKDLFSQESVGRVSSVLKQVAAQTFLIEAVGVLLIFICYPDENETDLKNKIFHSLFHSVSSFCNAGFSTFPQGFETDWMLNRKEFLSVVMVLIVLGGLGFPTVHHLIHWTFKIGDYPKRMELGAKLILTMSVGLIVFGAVSYYVLETNNTLSELSAIDGMFHSLFYSVSTRTAGFNTLSISKMGTPMVFVSLFLMWVGASPNGTGGGIKTTTLAVSVLHLFNHIRGKEELEVFGKRISSGTTSRASAGILISLFLIFFGIFFLTCTENSAFLDLCYEVVSAFGTAGLSRGITSSLTSAGKLLICLTMFCGRVGMLTILIALVPKEKKSGLRFPEESIIVG
ncbi:TrkH family potassium uptake protein [Leptospira alstonii]|uniref:Cation transport protein n=2 Tax=Leptospira alstonii TaxID=28452 RepID=M6CR37_9LEPT|nr:potassium transporter TrkG [Leptospira alstonii]EMJ94397.1 cation transport protein [Leptospira alstonii serovar Sichuan str. 79601]EQA82544.1 cation transport protein [Leptospira alstonii serovar Pingchang str. 80-412]